MQEVEKKGKTKSGHELWLFIDPKSEPSCSLTLWALGHAIGLEVETPEEATALYEALLNVKNVDAD